MKAIVAERGQVTIPKVLRLKLGIRPGTVLDFEVEDGSLVAVKANQSSAVERSFGCLGTLHTNQIIKQLRGNP